MAADPNYGGTNLQRRADGTDHVPSGGTLTTESGSTFNVAGTFQMAGVGVTATAAQLNSTSRISANASRLPQIAKIALAAVDTGGGVFSWVNPEAVAINVLRVDVEVDTIATGACSIDVGITAVSATTQSDTLIDGLDIHTATGVFTTIDQAGTNGKSRGQVAIGGWITATKDSGASAGIVGNAFIQYYLAN